MPGPGQCGKSQSAENWLAKTVMTDACACCGSCARQPAWAPSSRSASTAGRAPSVPPGPARQASHRRLGPLHEVPGHDGRVPLGQSDQHRQQERRPHSDRRGRRVCQGDRPRRPRRTAAPNADLRRFRPWPPSRRACCGRRGHRRDGRVAIDLATVETAVLRSIETSVLRSVETSVLRTARPPSKSEERVRRSRHVVQPGGHHTERHAMISPRCIYGVGRLVPGAPK